MPSRWKRSQRCAQVGHSYVMEQVMPLPAWDDETSFLKSLTAFPLASLGRDSSLCPTGDFVTCRVASASEQPTLANGSPEESPGFPTALTVTAIVFHGNRSKAAEVSRVLAPSQAYVCSFQILVGPSFSRGFAGPREQPDPQLHRAIRRQGRNTHRCLSLLLPSP